MIALFIEEQQVKNKIQIIEHNSILNRSMAILKALSINGVACEAGL